MEPLNANSQRVYETPALYKGSGATPIPVPSLTSSWTSFASVYQITDTTAFFKGKFVSTIALNSDDLCIMPAGFNFVDRRPVTVIVSSAFETKTLVGDSSNGRIYIGEVMDFGIGDVVCLEFSFNIVPDFT